MILIISEKAQIPHIVGEYNFNPFCKVKDEDGKNFIRAYPNFFKEITKEESESIDSTKWKKFDILQGKGLKEATELLSLSQKTDVLNYIKNILSPKVELPKEIVEVPKGKKKSDKIIKE